MIHEAIAKVVTRQDLSEAEMAAVMEQISLGRATPIQIGAFLVALGMKGETVEEITGAVRVLRSKRLPVSVDHPEENLVDTCGTGGDGVGTFNVSTTTAFVVAGCGVRVAKHGNRSVSSRCGSADVMEALGVNLDLTPDDLAVCIDRVGIGFLFAPLLHPAMRHAVHPRRELGIKSIFNLAGPLINPAGASTQVLGVYRADLTETLARVLARLGCRSAFVVHGHDGCDEMTITGPTRVTRLDGERISTGFLSPEALGLRRADFESIRGGDAARNAEILLSVLNGEGGPCRDMVLMNAAAAVTAAGRTGSLEDGVRLAAESIDSGRALEKMHALIAFSRDLAARRNVAGA